MTALDAGLLALCTAAALVQATTGFGFSLIVAPALALTRPDLLPGVLILLMIPLNAFVAWRERHAIDLHGAGWITAGRVVGGGVGLALLMALSLRGLNLLVGLSTLAAVAASMLAPSFRPGRAAYAGAGLVTGITETATGIGGPPLALVFQHEPPASLRANVATCFLAGQILTVVLLLASGSLTLVQTVAAATILPGVVLGMLLSGPAARRVNARWLRAFVLLFAAASAVLLIARP